MRLAAWRLPLFVIVSLLWLSWGAWMLWATEGISVDGLKRHASTELVALDGPVTFDGAVIQGGVIRGRTAPGSRVWLRGKPLRVSPRGHFVFGFGRDETGTARLEVETPDGRRHRRALSIVERRYHEQRVEGVPGRTVTPSPEHLARIRNEAKQVRRARSPHTEREDFAGPFRWPLHGPITGVYGSQRFYNGQPRQPHFGVDVARLAGTPVTAPAGGVVRLAHPDMFYSGGTLVIDHGYGLFSTMIHMREVDVSIGDELRAGDPVGTVGASGRATGPHLDWRINWFDVRLDPVLLVGPMPVTPEADPLAPESPNDAH